MFMGEVLSDILNCGKIMAHLMTACLVLLCGSCYDGFA